MKKTADTQSDSLLGRPTSGVLLRAMAEGERQWIQPASQSVDTEHLADLRVEDLSGEFGLDPHLWHDLLEAVCQDGWLDELLARDGNGNVALSLELNVRDRFA